MPQTLDPVALRDAYIQAYRMRQPTQAAPTFNPMDAALFGQFSQGQPTTSPIGEIARGILAAYVGRRMGRDQLAYDDAQRQREREEARQEWDRRQEATLKHELGLFGTKQAFERASQLNDPEKFLPMTPAMRGNVETVTGLFASNPEFMRAAKDDPTVPLKAVRSVTSPNPELGLFGAQPFYKPVELSKDANLVHPVTGELIASGPKGVEYKERTQLTADGMEFKEFSLDGGASWQQFGDVVPRWKDDAAGKGGGVDLQIQKELSDLVDGRIGVWTQDPNDSFKTIRAVPPELQDLKLYLTGRATNILNENPGMPAAIAVKIAYDEAEVSGIIPKIQEAPPPDTRGWLDRLTGAEAPTAAPPRLGPSGIDPRHLGYEVTPRTLQPGPGPDQIPGGGAVHNIPLYTPAESGGNPLAPNDANAAASPAAVAPPADIIPPAPTPPAPSLMGMFGLTPQLQRDAQGWYAPQGGSQGGKRYLSPKEVAQETLNQLGQTPQQDNSGRWFVSLGGRGGRRYLSDDELERLDAALGTMTKRVNVVP